MTYLHNYRFMMYFAPKIHSKIDIVDAETNRSLPQRQKSYWIIIFTFKC